MIEENLSTDDHRVAAQTKARTRVSVHGEIGAFLIGAPPPRAEAHMRLDSDCLHDSV